MKNLKSLICGGVTTISSILFLIFMSQPFLDRAGVAFSGYGCIDCNTTEGKHVTLAIMLALATFVACLFIVSYVYTLLRYFNVIKVDKFDKLMKWINFGLGLIAIVSMSIALIMAVCIPAEINSNALNLNIASVDWGVGVNFALAIITAVAASIDKFYKE